MGGGIAVGIGIGVAIGAALDSVAIGVAIGVGIGAALGVVWSQPKRPNGDGNSAHTRSAVDSQSDERLPEEAVMSEAKSREDRREARP